MRLASLLQGRRLCELSHALAGPKVPEPTPSTALCGCSGQGIGPPACSNATSCHSRAIAWRPLAPPAPLTPPLGTQLPRNGVPLCCASRSIAAKTTFALAVATAAAATASLTFGIATPGLPARRSALAGAFHVSLTLVQAGFWWRFTGGRSVAWYWWLSLALLAGCARAGLRVWTVLLDETDVLADVELPALVMKRTMQRIAFRLYFVGVGLIQVAVRARA